MERFIPPYSEGGGDVQHLIGMRGEALRMLVINMK